MKIVGSLQEPGLILHMGNSARKPYLKIIAGLRCNWDESEKILKLAGFYLANSRMDRLVKAAIFKRT